jgi:GH15 family glucan-1,4-alpha-glucosidase
VDVATPSGYSAIAMAELLGERSVAELDRDGRSDEYLSIGDYAAVGDGRSLALVGRDGAIDWLCLPELDAPSVFGALLDPERGGTFWIRPTAGFSVTRRYLERTNVLETTFTTEQGTIRVLDAMTLDTSESARWRELVRRVEGVSGEVPVRWRYAPRFDYGQVTPRFESHNSAVIARHGSLQLGFQVFGCELDEESGGGVTGGFKLRSGDSVLFALTAAESEPLPLPPRSALERRLAETVAVWRSWVSRHDYRGPWRDAVERSLLALRLLTDGRTGAIAAAATTSLPEAIGGERNYDYRFGWVRDLCFALDALLAIGMQELVHTAIGWVLEATARTHPRIDPVYALAGPVVRSQTQLPLPGYQRTSPVWRGNKAGAQLQLGGFGDLLETMAIYARAGHVLDPGTGERLADAADLLTSIWARPDAGLWELPDQRQYGTSKLGCWTAFDRIIELADAGQVPARHVARWRDARDQVRRFIDARLCSAERGNYLFAADGEELDCGMLLAGRRSFPDPDRRLASTIAAIRSELGAGGPLLYRYSGMQDEENAFLCCSFWLVEALALTGELDAAAEVMGAMVGLGNDVGLYSEEMEPSTHALRGNFPQALTHLSLISAAHTLARESGS